MSVGTWAGIQAARTLQEKSIDCEITDVYSVAQAAAAVQAKAAVLVLNLTHINLWYDQHPGAIRDPQVQLFDPADMHYPLPTTHCHYHHTSSC
jgi:transaldolase